MGGRARTRAGARTGHRASNEREPHRAELEPQRARVRRARTHREWVQQKATTPQGRGGEGRVLNAAAGRWSTLGGARWDTMQRQGLCGRAAAQDHAAEPDRDPARDRGAVTVAVPPPPRPRPSWWRPVDTTWLLRSARTVRRQWVDREQLAQACVKNCGLIFHQEVANKIFMNALIKHVNDKVNRPDTPHPLDRRTNAQAKHAWESPSCVCVCVRMPDDP